MKTITQSQMQEAIDEAIAKGKKNILFVSPTIEVWPIIHWFEKHPEYTRRGDTPKFLYDYDEAGNIVKYEDNNCMYPSVLEELNAGNVVLFVYPFGDECIVGFKEYLDVLTKRTFTNHFLNEEPKTYPLDKLVLFIAASSPSGLDGFSLDESYYGLFDEVYFVE
ncbi:MAG: hypothetical protein K6E59_06180 [Bacilli bacterium]|nr:hypothetical protein [Bacilli bacterium]